MSVHALTLPLSIPSPIESTRLRSVPVAALPSQPATKTRRAAWLAIHLDGWQLHAAMAALTPSLRESLSTQPVAIAESDRRATLVACNAMAHAHGVRLGHSLNASIALCAQLQFLPRDQHSETQLLESLAAHCERYTSTVSVEAPNQLLLEVRGSIKLFGGIEALMSTLSSDLTSRGCIPQLALAPTAQAALWLSRAAATPVVVTPRHLMARLAPLRVSHLSWPADIELRLARFGVLTIGDLLRLPRAGLARRIGHERLAELDYALGRHRQVRRRHQSTQSYVDVVLLDFEIETTGLLSTVIEKRMQRLHAYLARRTLATDRLHIDLQHRDRSITPLIIGLAGATSDTLHIAKLMREHLGKLVLAAPVAELRIRVDRLLAQPAVSCELFSSQLMESVTVNTDAQARLLEQLTSRVGSRLQQVTAQPDYRPELANRVDVASMPGALPPAQIPPSLATRPLWLLPTPRAIRSRGTTHAYPSAEVVESGWWDGQPVLRHYSIARSRRGARAWTFHEAHAPQQRFVHGLFG
jgi:protein ImuB